MKTTPSVRAPSRTQQALVLIGATAGVLAPFLLYVWAHVQMLTTGYRIEATESRIQALQQENRTLRLERGRLSASPFVEERARKLGFVPIAPARIVRVVATGTRRREVPALRESLAAGDQTAAAAAAAGAGAAAEAVAR